MWHMCGAGRLLYSQHCGLDVISISNVLMQLRPSAVEHNPQLSPVEFLVEVGHCELRTLRIDHSHL